MRYHRSGSVTLSEDEATKPKQIRFQDSERETIDTDIIIEGGGQTQVIEKSTSDYELPMGKISQGKWAFFYCSQEFQLKINGGSALTMAAEKVHEMWVEFTQLQITNPSSTDDMRLTWAIGGE